ncbi:MAG: dockerin type I domain-containing protein [Planctomycetota bacterium]
MQRFTFGTAALAAAACGLSAQAQITLDGAGIPSEGLTLLATQDSPTMFGNSNGADQGSPFGSELNQLFGDVDAGTGLLELGITGNLEANFNKLFIFFDAVPGGGINATSVDGGFNEVTNFETTIFDAGFEPDHGLRFEVGGGFLGINSFDLIDETSASVFSGGGIGDLPATGFVATDGIVSVGWDNANPDGVDDVDASGAATATSGIEIAIDVASFFGGSTLPDIKVMAIITSGGGDFPSNQILPGVNSVDNLGTTFGSTALVDFTTITGDQFATIPNPLGSTPTLPGDANNDGTVDLLDFDVLAQNFGSNTGNGAAEGDFNGDGVVDLLDFDILAQNFGSSSPAAVPEPASLALLGLGGAALLRRRRA